MSERYGLSTSAIVSGIGQIIIGVARLRRHVIGSPILLAAECTVDLFMFLEAVCVVAAFFSLAFSFARPHPISSIIFFLESMDGEMMLTGRCFSFPGPHLRHALTIFSAAQATCLCLQLHFTNHDTTRPLSGHPFTTLPTFPISNVFHVLSPFAKFPFMLP